MNIEKIIANITAADIARVDSQINNTHIVAKCDLSEANIQKERIDQDQLAR